jgi:acyl carrier protein
MTRDEVKSEIIRIFRDQFEIENPGIDDDLRDAYEFDSIDAIELLREIEIMLGSELTQAEKKNAMEIRTINHILDYIESLSSARAMGQPLSN